MLIKLRKFLILFLCAWATAASYFAVESPTLKPYLSKVFTNSTDEKSLDLNLKYTFLENVLNEYYSLEESFDVDKKVNFVKRKMSSDVTSLIIDDYRQSLRSLKERSVTREVSVLRGDYLPKRGAFSVYILIVESLNAETSAYYIKVTANITRKSDNTLLLSSWQETPFLKSTDEFKEKTIFMNKNLKTYLSFPCNITSLKHSNNENVDIQLLQKDKVIGLLKKEETDDLLSITAKCKRRFFEPIFGKNDSKWTIFQKIELSDGVLPKKVKTEEEKIFQQMKNWKD